MATTGRRIAGARIEAGLTQQELAEAAGVSQSAVQQWEADRTRPRVNKLKLIAEAVGKPIAHFLTDDAPEDAAAATAEVGGVTISGPEDLLQRIVSTIAREAEAADEAEQLPAIAEGRLPNPRHSGIHELIGLQERGELKERTGIELTQEEESGLRTYGRSGPPVDSLERAVDVVLQWRRWETEDMLRRGKR